MSAIASRRSSFAAVVRNYHNDFANESAAPRHSAVFIKNLLADKECASVAEAAKTDPRVTSTDMGAVVVGLAKQVMTNEKAARAFVDIELNEDATAMVVSFDDSVQAELARSVVGPAGNVAQLCKPGDKLGEGVVSDLLIILVEPAAAVVESMVKACKTQIAEGAGRKLSVIFGAAHASFGDVAHKIAVKHGGVLADDGGDRRVWRKEYHHPTQAAANAAADEVNAAAAKLKAHTDGDEFGPARPRADVYRVMAEGAVGSDDPNICPDCGRPHVDGMTLNSTGGIQKNLCYKSEYGHDKRCDAIARNRAKGKPATEAVTDGKSDVAESGDGADERRSKAIADNKTHHSGIPHHVYRGSNGYLYITDNPREVDSAVAAGGKHVHTSIPDAVAEAKSAEKRAKAKADAAAAKAKSDKDKDKGVTEAVFKYAYGDAAWEALNESDREILATQHLVRVFGGEPKATTGLPSFDAVFSKALAASRAVNESADAFNGVLDDFAFDLHMNFSDVLDNLAEATIHDNGSKKVVESREDVLRGVARISLMGAHVVDPKIRPTFEQFVAHIKNVTTA